MGKKPLQINKKCQNFQTEKKCVRNLNAYENQQRYCKFALDCYLLLSSIETVQTQEKQQSEFCKFYVAEKREVRKHTSGEHGT